MRLRKNSNGAAVLFHDHDRPERRRRNDYEATEEKIISVGLAVAFSATHLADGATAALQSSQTAKPMRAKSTAVDLKHVEGSGKGKRASDGAASILPALNLEKRQKLKRCESPVCAAEFEPSGLAMEPRRFCKPSCRMNAWIVKRAAGVLKDIPDERALAILRGGKP